MFARALWEVARKEVLQHIRTKRLLIISSLFFATLVLITIVVPVAIFGVDNLETAARETGEDAPALENLAFLFYLNASVLGGYFFIQLLAIVLTADSITSEWQNRSIFLLLSKPVPRSAFVLGKYLGSIVTVVGAFTAMFTLDYLILQAVLPGSPDGGDLVGFIGMLAILALGACAVAAMALFFSSLAKSSVLSLILSLGFALIVFPLVGNIGDFTYFADRGDTADELDESDWRYDWSHYVSPERSMVLAGATLVGEEEASGGFTFLIPQFPPHRVWLSLLSTGMMAVAFVGLALVVVQRRNFE